VAAAPRASAPTNRLKRYIVGMVHNGESARRRRTDSREPITAVVRADGTTVFKAVVDAGRGPDGRRRQRRATLSTLAAARSWVARTRAELEQGDTPPDPAGETLGELAERYLSTLRDLRPATVIRYRDQLARTLALIGDVRVVDLTHRHVADAMRVLETGADRRRAVKASTVGHVLTIVAGALDLAVKDRLVGENVARQVRRPRREPHEAVVWTPEQVRTFVAAADGHRYAAGLLLSVAGLRRGEVMGLRWCDVDAEAGTVVVRQSRVVGQAGETITGRPKVAAARRTVPVLALFGVGRALAVECERQVSAGVYRPDGLVLLDDAGGALDPPAYSRAFTALVTRLGLPPATLHQLRHAAASALLANGTEPVTVAGLLGHSASVLLRNYARPLPEKTAEAAALLGALYAPTR